MYELPCTVVARETDDAVLVNCLRTCAQKSSHGTIASQESPAVKSEEMLLGKCMSPLVDA